MPCRGGSELESWVDLQLFLHHAHTAGRLLQAVIKSLFRELAQQATKEAP